MNAKRIARRIVATSADQPILTGGGWREEDMEFLQACRPRQAKLLEALDYPAEWAAMRRTSITSTSDGATVSVGDKITNPGGVNATDIPVGATVRYSTGVDQKTGDYEVILSKGKKMLGSGGTPLWVGQDGPMTVLSLPGTAIPEPHDGPDYSVSKAEPGV